MSALVIIVIFLLMGICGSWIMDQVDRFLSKYVGEEGADESESEGSA